MTKAIKYYFLIVPVLVQACSSMYIPSSMSTPLLEKKNDIQIEAGASTNSIYLSGGYAFSEKYALVINGSLSFRNFSNRYDLANSSNDDRSSGPFSVDLFPSAFSHRYIEVGAGRYNLLSSAWKLEVFGGGGYGHAMESDVYKNKYWLGFVQGNFGRKWNVLELGWSLRMACSGFYFTYPSETNLYQHLNFNNVHIEPLAFIRIGNGTLQGFARGGISLTTPLKSFPDIK